MKTRTNVIESQDFDKSEDPIENSSKLIKYGSHLIEPIKAIEFLEIENSRTEAKGEKSISRFETTNESMRFSHAANIRTYISDVLEPNSSSSGTLLRIRFPRASKLAKKVCTTERGATFRTQTNPK
uniref:Uncharacterized protein n=1 Tax=Vespula pensylvanica TaxID=30213 RepID=A0A834U485_VESPE|nr:hypothetical protein H0235_012210 [Vespula pensylvanica]